MTAGDLHWMKSEEPITATDREAAVTDLGALLQERGKVHGDFTDHARITCQLKDVLTNESLRREDRMQPPLTAIQREALSMIVHKIGRILAGNADHADHWDDIAGYAKLVSDRVSTAAPETAPSPVGFWYLATPYSKYPGGIWRAFNDASYHAALLIKAGIPVFCPIAHSHPIACMGEIDPFDHGVWLPADEPMMHAAKGLIVCKMEGWEISFGIAQEIETFTKAGKPIVMMEPGTIPELA